LEPGAEFPFRGETHVIAGAAKGPSPVWRDKGTIWVRGEEAHSPRRVLDFLKREARSLFEERALALAAKLGAAPSRITVRDTASRWGSCSSARSLSFSWRLILAPDFVLDYVVAHEVAHLREMNHSARFWRLLESIVDNVERAQRWLAQNGTTLHRYAPGGVE
jgi:predicted metal-dependent hydrolase